MIRELFNKLTGGSQPAAPEPQPVEQAAEAAAPEGMDRVGWVSPDYTISRLVKLDPGLVRNNRCVANHESSPEMEQYRVLRTRILHRTSNGSGKIVMITSSIPGEGKSLTAINLAFTFARDYDLTALLVDCDLKQQSIHKLLGFASDRGLADHLLHGHPLADLMVWPDVEKLTIISGGNSVGASSELLGSPTMRHLVAEMRDRYPNRYIFLDTPPVLAGADAMALAPLVDHILFVVQSGRTPLQDIRKALHLLPKEKILGLVFNRQPADQIIPYYSGYLKPEGEGPAARQ
jgi:non-specific protein-tyrosine kinase